MSPDALLAARVAALEATFRTIAATRMAGLPLLNLALPVQAVGFARESHSADVALGVLVTPWFMSLLRLPLSADSAASMPAVGLTQARDCGPRCFDFIGADEPGIGRYATSALFSPMFDFADAAAALSTAQEVLALLRAAPVAVPATPPMPARRGFLFGRTAGGAPR